MVASVLKDQEIKSNTRWNRFIANWAVNASLDYTSVASATILSSMSGKSRQANYAIINHTPGFFTLGIGRIFRVEMLTLAKIGAVITRFVSKSSMNSVSNIKSQFRGCHSCIPVRLCAASAARWTRVSAIGPCRGSCPAPDIGRCPCSRFSPLLCPLRNLVEGTDGLRVARRHAALLRFRRALQHLDMLAYWSIPPHNRR